MSELFITLPDGTDAIVSGLPDQHTIAETVTTVGDSKDSHHHRHQQDGLEAQQIALYAMGFTSIILGAVILASAAMREQY
jgi:hypothetical protein